ncbi:E3 ubiquitin-protein ligase SINA-like 10 [Cardamine amara subsp. amara]|uniref:RING-type E3 ubiquitin transferase n=1 Tax=Cardamine amara subsp. amara TaxID=228776 RepID=A0ABD1AKQ3_CARAN
MAAVRSFPTTIHDSSHVSVMILDSDVLDCPTCCKPLKSPIFQCTNGHIACSSCCVKVKNKCPSCKLPIGLGKNRCGAMEKVIEATRVSCPNKKYGCKENVSYENVSSHGKECVCSCPVQDCNFAASSDDIYNHLHVQHKDELNQMIQFIDSILLIITGKRKKRN